MIGGEAQAGHKGKAWQAEGTATRGPETGRSLACQAKKEASLLCLGCGGGVV